jgi:hypothetical protein
LSLHRARSTPFLDEVFAGPHTIPGRILCAYFDRGGEGVAYHEAAERNHGSGELNPLDGSYLNGFRADEPVGTSFTKGEGIDDHGYNVCAPSMGMLYVGWTSPGNWIRFTVEVASTASYTASLLYTAPRGGAIAIAVDDDRAAEEIEVPSTYDPADEIDWRQAHHWSLLSGIRLGPLAAGVHTLTLHTVAEGGMNYGWIDVSPSRLERA